MCVCGWVYRWLSCTFSHFSPTSFIILTTKIKQKDKKLIQNSIQKTIAQNRFQAPHNLNFVNPFLFSFTAYKSFFSFLFLHNRERERERESAYNRHEESNAAIFIDYCRPFPVVAFLHTHTALLFFGGARIYFWGFRFWCEFCRTIHFGRTYFCTHTVAKPRKTINESGV